jgi:hypothetical protein
VEIETLFWDTELSPKIAPSLENEKIHINPSYYYSFDLVFDTSIYNDAKFYGFDLKKPVPNKNYPRWSDSDQEYLKDILYAVLSEQLHNAVEAVAALGFDICGAGIIGDKLESSHSIQIAIYEDKEREYDRKGKEKKIMKVFSVMPSRPESSERVAKFFVEKFWNDYKNEKIKEAEIAAHTPNMVRIQDLMIAVATGVLADERMNKARRSEAINELANKLFGNDRIQSTWPFEMCGRFDERIPLEAIKIDDEVDCPEYMVFTEHKDGSWQLKKVAGPNVAQTQIIKDEYNRKNVIGMAVIHDLMPVPFSLFAETDYGWYQSKNRKLISIKSYIFVGKSRVINQQCRQSNSLPVSLNIRTCYV